MELCTLYLLACHVRITVGVSGLCCCVCVTSFERELTPLCVDNTAGVIITSSLFLFCLVLTATIVTMITVILMAML